jgi:hypothetical protein
MPVGHVEGERAMESEAFAAIVRRMAAFPGVAP